MMRFLIFLIALSIANEAPAGKWEIIDGDPRKECRFRFSGQIAPGDLTGFIAKFDEPTWPTPIICLDSDGGSLAEVYNFINFFQNHRERFFATRVESGKSCLSSCAILFMFGEKFGINNPYPSREVEPGARLGFHSPYIAPGRIDQTDAADAFRVALDVSKLLLDSSYTAVTGAGPSVPPEILALVLGTPADSMTYVDRLGELQIVGITPLTNPEDGVILANNVADIEQVVRRVCASSYVISYRNFFANKGYNFDDLILAVDSIKTADTVLHHLTLYPAKEAQSSRIVAMASGPYHLPGLYSAWAALFCQVEFAVEQTASGFEVHGYYVGFGGPQFDWDSRLAEPQDIEQPGLAVGLLPIETPYR